MTVIRGLVVREWIVSRLALAMLLVFALVVFLRLTEIIVPPHGESRVVLNATAADCPQATSSVAVICEVNAIRAANGRRVIRRNARLRLAAARHSADMTRRRYFSHISPDGGTVTRRVRRAGYLRGAHRWSVGENIAWGQGSAGTPAAIVDAWMHSESHRRIILTQGWQEIGVGIVPGTPTAGPDGATYTMNVGRRVPRRTSRWG